MMAHHVFGMSAITALTAQNTTGVIDIMEVTPKFLEEELQCIFTDIYPDAVKIGMVSSAELMEVIARNTAIATLKRTLLPMADLLTPNIPEAEVLAEMEIFTEEDMIAAARKISEAYGCAVLCKGGHQKNDANDLLYQNGTFRWFRGRRIENPNTHGTGCTLSSAIASNLAKGFSMEESVENAKNYISGALEAMLDLGKGSGPMDHAFRVEGVY